MNDCAGCDATARIGSALPVANGFMDEVGEVFAEQ
jgi:hypothetical protein